MSFFLCKAFRAGANLVFVGFIFSSEFISMSKFFISIASNRGIASSFVKILVILKLKQSEKCRKFLEMRP